LNPDCPHPEHWHSANGSATEQEVGELVAALVRALQPGLVVETGSCRGHTSLLVGQALAANGHGKLISFEPRLSLVRRATRRCRGLPVEFVHGTVEDWRPSLSATIDFAYIDSSYADRVPSFLYLHHWMSTRTIVAFHDSAPQHPLLARLHELEKEGWIKPVYLPTPRGICIARVMR
jgi:predicted O-methyltransferase YrrM